MYSRAAGISKICSIYESYNRSSNRLEDALINELLGIDVTQPCYIEHVTIGGGLFINLVNSWQNYCRGLSILIAERCIDRILFTPNLQIIVGLSSTTIEVPTPPFTLNRKNLPVLASCLAGKLVTPRSYSRRNEPSWGSPDIIARMFTYVTPRILYNVKQQDYVLSMTYTIRNFYAHLNTQWSATFQAARLA